MKRQSNKLISTFGVVSIVFSVLLLLSTNVMAEISIGGELETTISGYLLENGDGEHDSYQSLDLELFIPPLGETDFKVQFVLHNPEVLTNDGYERISFKKLYLKHKFNDYYITVGRQPISWSFGSMLNPVDFTMGAVAMDEETMGKYQDAIELYYPINWNSSFELIAADTPLSDDLKWGVRGRVGYKGYDLTFNYIKENINSNPFFKLLPISNLLGSSTGNQIAAQKTMMDRIGFTAKGDLGPIGAYSALGIYNMEGKSEPSYSYLLGADYSYLYNYDKRINMQFEVLALQDEVLTKSIENLMGMEDVGETLDLMLANISYPIDDFSNIGLSAIASLDDGSTVLIPAYQNQLPANIKLSLSSSLFLGEKDKLLSVEGIDAVYQLSLTYAF